MLGEERKSVLVCGVDVCSLVTGGGGDRMPSVPLL